MSRLGSGEVTQLENLLSQVSTSGQFKLILMMCMTHPLEYDASTTPRSCSQLFDSVMMVETR